MDCKPKLFFNVIKTINILFLLAVSTRCMASGGFHLPALSPQSSAIYDLKSTTTLPRADETGNSESQLSLSSVVQQQELTVGVSTRASRNLREQAQRIIESLQGIFQSPNGQAFFAQYPAVSVEPSKIFSNTSEVLLTISTTDGSDIQAAKQALIRLLTQTPGIKFAGETRTISVD